MKIVLPGEPLLYGSTALRPWRDRDIEAIFLACQDPEIARWTNVPEPYGETDAQAYLLHRHDALQAGAAAPFAIVDADNLDTVFGSISLTRITWEHARGEVGYWLASEARGTGHATRALSLISTWAFEALGLHRVELFAATANERSQRVAERAGFTREALLRSYMKGRDGRQDMYAFGLLRSDLSATPVTGHAARAPQEMKMARRTLNGKTLLQEIGPYFPTRPDEPSGRSLAI